MAVLKLNQKLIVEVDRAYKKVVGDGRRRQPVSKEELATVFVKVRKACPPKLKISQFGCNWPQYKIGLVMVPSKLQ